MTEKITFQKGLSMLRYTLLMGVFVGVYSTAIAQQKDSTATDTLLVDGMSRKLNLQQRHINLWNRTVPKLLNTGGSTTIYNEDVNTTPVSDLTNALSGRVPGLSANRSSGRTGPMFDVSSLSLRGQAPLIVVDGVVRSFTSFNVDDVKSITFMKDAVSTSMYGLRSSNGVIYITTKDKSEGNPFELNFSAQYGAIQQTRRPNFITGADYAQLYNEAQQNSFPGATPAFSQSLIDAYKNGTNDPFLQANNDWYNSIYKKNTSQQRYAVNASGNGKNYRYYTALENFSQGGNFLTSDNNPYNTNNYYKRNNLRTNAQIDFTDDIQLTLNIFAAIENNNEPGVGSVEIMNRIYQTSPLAYPARNADGSYGGNPLNTVSVNSIAYGTNILGSTLSSGYINYNERSLSADVGLKFKMDDLVKGLWAKGMLSINNYYLQKISRTKTFAVYYPTTSGNAYTKIGSDGVIEAGKGVPTIATQNKQTYFNGMFGYDRTFGEHSLNVLATYNLTNLIDSYSQLNSIYQNAGVTASYNYAKTYLADLGLVYSGYNRYVAGDRWGFLPSLGLGWMVSNEQWFDRKTINLLKLRGSIGQTAWADPSNYYAYLQNYTVGATGTNGYNFGVAASAVSGAFENVLSNPNITWEKALKFDVGIEAQFLNNRLNVEVNYYNNKFVDQLIAPNNGYASGIIGQTYPLVNAGKTRYNGIETTVGFADRKKDFGYFIKGNVTLAKNKILSLAEGNYPYPWMYKAGSPSSGFGYEAIGFYQVGEDLTKTANIPGYTPKPGDIRYKDLNGDGVIDFMDQKAIMGDKPALFFGLNLGFNYNQFDFSALLEGRLNRVIYTPPSSMLAFNNGYGYVLDYTTANRWTPQNSLQATLPSLTLGSNAYNEQTSTFWVKKADYLRLKNIEIGYSLPTKLLSKAKLNKLRVFVNAYNLFTVTQLKYIDPETSLSGFTNSRVINGGVSLKL